MPMYIDDVTNEGEKRTKDELHGYTDDWDEEYVWEGTGYFCSQCNGKLYKEWEREVWRCEKGVISSIDRHKKGYKLCTTCMEFKREKKRMIPDQIELHKKNLLEQQIEDKDIPICMCGEKLLLLDANQTAPKKYKQQCIKCYRKCKGEATIWYCINDDPDKHILGHRRVQVKVCARCVKTPKLKANETESRPSKWDNWKSMAEGRRERRERTKIIGKENIEKASIDYDIPKCKCGEELLLLKRREIYIDTYVSRQRTCYICEKQLKENDDLWHCDEFDNWYHRGSNFYDICVECAEKGRTKESYLKEKNKELDTDEKKTDEDKLAGAIELGVKTTPDETNEDGEKNQDKDGDKDQDKAEEDNENGLEIVTKQDTVDNNNKDESYDSDDEVLNNDDEKEEEYVTPGGD